MKRYIFILFCLIFLLSGCQSAASDEESVTDYNKLIQSPADIDFGDTAYNIETDSQNYYDFSTRRYAATGDGYYTFERAAGGFGEMLVFIDKETLSCIPVCSKADCMHNDGSCDAYFDVGGIEILNYYNGNLYGVLTESDGNITTYYLYRVSLDGSIREKVFDIYSADERGSRGPKFIIHRGYIYYLYEDGETYNIAKRDIDGSNMRVIYSMEYESGIIDNINGYGEGALFSVQKDRYDAYSNAILYYSTITDTLYEIRDNVYWQYGVTEDDIVYTDGNDIYKINFDTMEEEPFIEDVDGMVIIKYDGRYLYVDNINVLWKFGESEKSDFSNRKIDVYDLEGELIDTIVLAGQSENAYIGDEEYMFFSFEEGGSWVTKAFDKSQIGSGKHKWLEINGM